MGEDSNVLRRAVLRTGRATLVVGLAGLLLPPAAAVVRSLNDRIDRAPAERTFNSPSGRYVLVVAAVDGWKTPRTTATLRNTKGQVRWRLALPHEGGPRAVLVNNDGAVLFIDEWINVIPRHGLMLIGADGKLVADHGGEAILSALNVPRRTIGDLARVGPWRSSDAVLSPDGKSASLRAGGRTVTVSITNGAIKVSG